MSTIPWGVSLVLGCSGSSPEPHEAISELVAPTQSGDEVASEKRTAPPPVEKPPYDPAAALLDPSLATLAAPKEFTVKLKTTKGDILVDVHREWAPFGADRFYNLVKAGYYNGTAFFRVINGFMAQAGIAGDPKVNEAWRSARIPDDRVLQSNRTGYLSFAATQNPNSRTTQFFINFRHNQQLDGMRFAPFGKARNMEVVNQLYSGYGEGTPRGKGPSQGSIQKEGNAYLKKAFPRLDYILTATIVEAKGL
ncbi:MAG: peptidylprolyl isomerase [Myxococcales bacterium]|nr:peptidylprolyl isomerase [Myxococcales bacterium]